MVSGDSCPCEKRAHRCSDGRGVVGKGFYDHGPPALLDMFRRTERAALTELKAYRQIATLAGAGLFGHRLERPLPVTGTSQRSSLIPRLLTGMAVLFVRQLVEHFRTN